MSGLGGIVAIIILIWRIRGGKVAPWFWVWLAKCGLIAGVIVIVESADTVSALLFSPAVALVCAPTLVLEWIVVPLRLPRVAYWIVRCCLPLGCLREIRASAAMYGALALARKGASAKTTAWLEQRLNAEQRMRGAGVVAAGLLAALRRDREQARCLLLIADALSPRFASRRMRAIARDWLVADAARIGDWHTVISLGRRGKNSLRWSYAMARIGERLTGDKRACGNWRLWLYFLMAPRRRATYPLLRRALAMPVRPPAPDGKPGEAAALPLALAELARAIENKHINSSMSFARTVGAVHGSLVSMRPHIDERLRALGGRGDGDDVISAFRQRLIELLVSLLEEAPHLALAAEESPILSEAARQVRARLLRDVEDRCKDYHQRTAQACSLDAIPEWASWAVLRRLANRLLELHPESRLALFQTMYVPVTNFAVLQFNQYKRTALAHDMFAWLLGHAQSNDEARQLLTKNVRAARL